MTDTLTMWTECVDCAYEGFVDADVAGQVVTTVCPGCGLDTQHDSTDL